MLAFKRSFIRLMAGALGLLLVLVICQVSVTTTTAQGIVRHIEMTRHAHKWIVHYIFQQQVVDRKLESPSEFPSIEPIFS